RSTLFPYTTLFRSRKIVAENVVHVALIALAPNGHGLYPIGAVFGRVLLKERRLIDAIGITLQRERLVLEVRHEHRRDARVIVDDLPFSESSGWIENLVEVRQLQLSPVNFDDLVGRWHEKIE